TVCVSSARLLVTHVGDLEPGPRCRFRQADAAAYWHRSVQSGWRRSGRTVSRADRARTRWRSASSSQVRGILRKLCGPIVIESDEDGSVWARFDLHPAALLSQAAGTVGRDDRI